MATKKRKGKKARKNPTFRRTKDGKVIAYAPSSGRHYSVKGETRERSSKFMNERKAAIARGEKPKSRKRLPDGQYETVGSAALMLRYGGERAKGPRRRKPAVTMVAKPKPKTKRPSPQATPTKPATPSAPVRQADVFSSTVGPWILSSE